MDKVVDLQFDTQTLVQTVRHEVSLYQAMSDIDTFHSLTNETQQKYAVVLIPGNKEDRPAWVVVMAQVVGDKVVILEDTTDKPLFEALMVNGGIPREQIVLAYQGEKIPEDKK